VEVSNVSIIVATKIIRQLYLLYEMY